MCWSSIKVHIEKFWSKVIEIFQFCLQRDNGNRQYICVDVCVCVCVCVHIECNYAKDVLEKKWSKHELWGRLKHILYNSIVKSTRCANVSIGFILK